MGFDSIGAQFIQRAIAAVGNYGEIYERTIGDYIPRTCSLNALASDRLGRLPAGARRHPLRPAVPLEPSPRAPRHSMSARR